MAERQLDDVFGIRPVPKRNKRGVSRDKLKAGQDKFRDLYRAKPGNICLYVLGPDDSSVSKVGVSQHPYRRMTDFREWNGQALRMCYIAEMTRAQGFSVEAQFHRACRGQGLSVEGEWVSVPRAELTRLIRGIIASSGISMVNELGDTGETASGEGASMPWEREDKYFIPIASVRRKKG